LFDQWLLVLQARLRRGRIVQHRPSDEQRKKDRQQYWRYEPLTNIEWRWFRHLAAFGSGASTDALSHR